MAEGYKEWTAGDILTAEDVNDYLAKQAVIVVADDTERDADLPSGVRREGMVIYNKATKSLLVYDGSSWTSPDNLTPKTGIVTATSGGTSSRGYFAATSDQTGIGSTTDLTGYTVTFTAVSGRLYKATAHLWVVRTNISNEVRLQITDGSNNVLAEVESYVADDDDLAISAMWIGTRTAGSTTIKLRMASPTGLGAAVTNKAGGRFVVEDIGPS